MPATSGLTFSKDFSLLGFPIDTTIDVSIDEIKLYNKALTQTNVQLDMNNAGIATNVCA